MTTLPLELEGRAPVLELRGVAHTYPGPPPYQALRPSNLAIRTGEYVALVGPSGAGKSTLLNILGLLETPTHGELRFEGQVVRHLSDGERSRLRGSRIGFVFQAFHLIPYRTALQNVEVGLAYGQHRRTTRRARSEHCLQAVGLAHRAHALPSQLSGGERQRVAIARALAVEPALLLCDEPTGNLDSKTAAGVLHLLEQLHANGNTVVVVTHDAAVAARADRSLTVVDGEVVAPDGMPS